MKTTYSAVTPESAPELFAMIDLFSEAMSRAEATCKREGRPFTHRDLIIARDRIIAELAVDPD